LGEIISTVIGEYTVDIIGIGRSGDGIARVQGIVIFVRNAKAGYKNLKIKINSVGIKTADVVSKQIVGYSTFTMSKQLQQLLKQELTVTQVLRIHGKQFSQITERYSDGNNGRCAIGVMMSYFGWDGTDDFDTAKVYLLH
jgi:predicted RNA-binding protein with TRAM domain